MTLIKQKVFCHFYQILTQTFNEVKIQKKTNKYLLFLKLFDKISIQTNKSLLKFIETMINSFVFTKCFFTKLHSTYKLLLKYFSASNV